MGMVVPKVRKHLCADALLRSVQGVFPTSQREFQSSIAYRLSYMKEEGTP